MTSAIASWYAGTTRQVITTVKDIAGQPVNLTGATARFIVAEEGLEARWSRHRRNAERLWQGLENLGLTLHVPIAYRLPTLTTVRVPEGVDETQVRLRLLNEYNIEIGGGLGELKGKVWRVALMGYTSSPEYIDLLTDAFERLLPK